MLTSPADTLVCDTVQIAKWQSNPAYDYNRELITPEINVFEWLSSLGNCYKRYSAAVLPKNIPDLY